MLNKKKRIRLPYSDFEIQRSRQQKFKTGVSVAAQKRTYVLQKIVKKRKSSHSFDTSGIYIIFVSQISTHLVTSVDLCFRNAAAGGRRKDIFYF